MRNNKILHILYPEKFFRDYIHFIAENFDSREHLFLYLKTRGDEPSYPNVKRMRFYRIPILFHWELYRLMLAHNKVMLHSLSKKRIVNFLFLFPWFSKKCYWLLWGGDMYYRLSNTSSGRKKNLGNYMFSHVVKKLGYILTHIKGDVDIARKEFGFKGFHYNCMLYPSNLFNDVALEKKSSEGLTLLLGNSSHKSNNHKEIIDRIAYLRNSDVRIFCPLSYGSKRVAEDVANYGNLVFGNKFIPLMNFISKNEYLELLGAVDVAIFNHWRQQGVGNIISLLGLGKTVYLRQEVTTWDMLVDKGITVKDVRTLDRLELIHPSERDVNVAIVKACFSKEVLVEQYKDIF